ncbi:PDZ domain-containing protein [Aneurinibacillus sp. Ricciae_BoGa-3]|uniref:PDZ domain-containing protein n=1 Tax=Aneurinibacillus sp. Ricciae_BoGa-3 TaxID=3022697 RepID=UPI00233FBC29|nr:PDZ domain-containing protein [Aneurinibacillus sp. Ricciae_BoGa-3]WCK54147.1 PDZ domain-containing protein [Aneurinibacillus sp. Ricciae_BoGa-3]
MLDLNGIKEPKAIACAYACRQPRFPNAGPPVVPQSGRINFWKEESGMARDVFLNLQLEGRIRLDIWSIPRFFMNPALYVFIAFIYLLFRRQVLLERRLFHVRITTTRAEVFRSIGFGLVGGVGASVVLLAFGVSLTYKELLSLWVISGVLALIHARFLSFSYAGGLLGVLAFVVPLFEGMHSPLIGWAADWLGALNIPSILALVSILLMAEGLLVRCQAESGASPVLVASKRGRIIGAFQLNRLWMMPLLIFTPAASGGFDLQHLPGWWPWFYAGAASLSLLPIPAVIGYQDTATTVAPGEKARQAGKVIFLYGLGLLMIAYAAKYWMPLALIGSLGSFALPEMMRYNSRQKEKIEKPLYVQAGNGVRVLAVIPGSPADLMEIVTGDVIIKINGVRVVTKDDIYPALQQQSAFCKMEVKNRDGNIKYVQRSLYQGEHHELGVILAPDMSAAQYADVRRASIFDLFRIKLNSIQGTTEVRPDEQHQGLEQQGKDVSL